MVQVDEISSQYFIEYAQNMHKKQNNPTPKKILNNGNLFQKLSAVLATPSRHHPHNKYELCLKRGIAQCALARIDHMIHGTWS